MYEPEQALLAIETAIGNGISQRQLAEFTICDQFPSGISTAMISRVINGTKQLSYPEFRRLSAVVDATSEIVRRSPAPVNWGDVRRIRQLIQEIISEKRNPPEVLDPRDAALLQKFSRGVELDDLCVEAKMDRSRLLAHIESLLRRSQVLVANKLQEDPPAA